MPASKKKFVTKLRSPEWRARRLAIATKRVRSVFLPLRDSKPIFILGRQRSGTGMLTRVFHGHRDVEVYDEHLNKDLLFHISQLEKFEIVSDLIRKSKFQAVCFKPLAQSHQLLSMKLRFPDAHFIWAFRDYSDTANSSLRKFENPTRAVRLVCTGQPGGGWFQDGISETTGAMLRRVYRNDLTDFDCACLAWWARNQIVIESGLLGCEDVTPLRYESVVNDPENVLSWLMKRIGLRDEPKLSKNISARSIGRHRAPEMDSQIRELCEETARILVTAFEVAYSNR